MTSIPSERVTPWHAGMQFPPRAQLPPGITILRLPALGTTWYERGFWYWSRRAGGVFVLGLGAAIWIGVIFTVIQAAGPAGSPGYLAALTGEVVFSLVTGALMFRHLWQLGVSGRGTRPGSARLGGTTGSLAMLAWSTGSAVAGAVILLCGLLTVGVMLAALAIWLTPVPPTEQYARRLMTEELRLHRHHGHDYTPPVRRHDNQQGKR